MKISLRSISPYLKGRGRLARRARQGRVERCREIPWQSLTPIPLAALGYFPLQGEVEVHDD